MKIRKLIIFLCVCVMALLSQGIPMYANEGESSTPVTYLPSEDELAKFKMQIIVVGEGSVYDGTKEIKGNSTIYELKYKDKKNFTLAPAKGYQIESIVCNNKDITNQLVNDVITVSQMDVDTVVTFVYREVSKPDSSPQTGDHTNVWKWITLVSMSGVVLFLLKKKKRKEQNKA